MSASVQDLDSLTPEQLIEVGVTAMAAKKGVSDDEEAKQQIRRTLQSLPPAHVKMFIESSRRPQPTHRD